MQLFGTRHHSPGASRELLALCESLRPDLILVEAPDDAAELLVELAADAVPPAAILAYTDQEPLRSQRLPLARYSPEYAVARWALAHSAAIETIDLPFSVTLAQALASVADSPTESPYDRCAKAAGYDDFDTYWESCFEPLRNGFEQAMLEFGKTLRALESPAPDTLLREAYMRRRIAKAQAGYDRVLVVCGAYHAPALTQGEAMTDAETAALPRVSCKLTLMPYSYNRLSVTAGYGAGVAAPLYHELLWENPVEASAEFLRRVAARMREQGVFRSTAEVVDAVLLAKSLASLRGRLPVLSDLRDAALAALGRGEPDAVTEALAYAETGNSVGSLPKGLRHNPVQDDFHRRVRALRLERVLSAAETELALDLRKDLDTKRSAFLHRLRVLAIPFAQQQSVRQARANWKELWVLQWLPETELALADALQHGVCVKDAALNVLTENLEQRSEAAGIARTLEQALLCNLPELMLKAADALQGGQSGGFADAIETLVTLDRILRYGTLRPAETAALHPLFDTLCLRACLDLPARCNCSDAESGMMLRLFRSLAGLFSSREPPSVWGKSVLEVARSLNAHPKLSGYAFALAPDFNDTLPRELSRRLSPALPPEHGAAWLEGFVSHNRSVLLARTELWKTLDEYIASLDEKRFRMVLPGFRRMFSAFTPQEKRMAAEHLRVLWGDGPSSGDVQGEGVDGELTAEELEALESLRDFRLL